jgi:hypothetical protein
MVGLFVIAATICVVCWLCYFTSSSESTLFAVGGVGSLFVCIFLIFGTAQGKLYLTKFTAGYQNATWLIIDNSGGLTMRHWVLDGYVKGCDQTDGWEFKAQDCDPCYVGGDSFVGRITKEQATGNYREQFNIPIDQEALH